VLGGSIAPDLKLDEVDPATGVLRLEHLDENALWRNLAACDVVVSLRSPTMGETSGMVVRALSLGKPLVVSDVGWFSELPDDVALKVPVDELEVDTLQAALELLATQEQVRRAMGEAAAELARREHDLERVAELYAAALEQAAGGATVAESILREVSQAAAEVGIDADAPEAAELARRLAEVELGRHS
jgi:glycosyltransferase involved in cell wall biosynthesis